MAAEKAAGGVGQGRAERTSAFCLIGALLVLAVLALFAAQERETLAVFHPHEMANLLAVGSGAEISGADVLSPEAREVLAASRGAPVPFLEAVRTEAHSDDVTVVIQYAASEAQSALEVLWEGEASSDVEREAQGAPQRAAFALPRGPGSVPSDGEAWQTQAFHLSLQRPGALLTERRGKVRALSLRVLWGGQGTLRVRRISLLSHVPTSHARAALDVLCLALSAFALALSLSGQTRKERRRVLLASLAFPGAFAVLFAAECALSRILTGTFAGLSAFRALELVLPALICSVLAALAARRGGSLKSTLSAALLALAFGLPFTWVSLSGALRAQEVLELGTSARLGLLLSAFVLALDAALSDRIRRNPASRPMALSFAALFLFALACPGVALLYQAVFGQIFAAPAIEAIWQTNPREAIRFASAFIPHLLALCAAVIGLAFGLMRFSRLRLAWLAAAPQLSQREVLGADAAFLLIALTLGVTAAHAPVVREAWDTASYFRRISPRRPPLNFAVRRLSPSESGEPEASAAPMTPHPVSHLILIGESATRDHLSLYGYTRTTSPQMSSLADSGDLLVFRNAYAGNKYTYHALEMALTDADQYDRRRFEESLSLPEALRAAGFKTVWLSNQERDFNRGMPFGLMAESCNVHEWTAHPAESFDGELVPLLEKHADASKDTVFFIHLNGSHLIYADRVPEAEKVFSRRGEAAGAVSVSDAYDDSILYTDKVISRLFETARRKLPLMTAAYFSDHGEVPGIPRDTFLWPMARIPFVLWLSPEYRARHPRRTARLEARQDEWWTNDLFFDLVLGLFDVFSDRVEPKNDLSGERWAMEKTSLTTENGRHFLACDPQAEEKDGKPEKIRGGGQGQEAP